MQTHKIESAPLTIGSGELVGLTEAQYGARAHNVELVEDEGNVRVVRAINPIIFKIGETIRLPDGPSKAVKAASAAAAAPKAAKGKAPAKKTTKTVANPKPAHGVSKAKQVSPELLAKRQKAVSDAETALDKADDAGKQAARDKLDTAKAALAKLKR